MQDISMLSTQARQIWSNDPSYLFKASAASEGGAMLHIIFDSKTYTVKLDASGSWQWQIPPDLTEGQHTVSFFYVDRAGNIGEAIQAIFNFDLSAPDKPEILTIYDDVGSEQGHLMPGDISDDLTPTLTGVAEPDSLVSIYSGNQLIGSVKANANGRWIFQAELEPGVHEIHVTATDRYGQMSEPSDSFSLTLVTADHGSGDRELTISYAWDNYGEFIGKLGPDSITDDRTPTFHGEGKTGETAYLYYRVKGSQNWSLIESVLIDSKGKWALDSDRLTPGEYQFAVSYNNNSPLEESVFDLHIISSSEFKPIITEAWDNAGVNTGMIISGEETNDNTPEVRGYAEANSIVYIKYYQSSQPDQALYGSTVANLAGKWSFTPPLALSYSSWTFNAGQALTEDAMGPDFSLTIVPYERVSELYDFNDIDYIPVTNRQNEINYRDLSFTNLTSGVKDSGLYTDYWPSQSNLGIMMQTPAFNKSVEYQVDFSHGVERISFTAIDWKTKNCYVAFYDDAGNEVGREYAKTSGLKVTEHFSFSSDIAFTSMKIHLQNLGGYSRLDNLSVDYILPNEGVTVDTELLMSDNTMTPFFYQDEFNSFTLKIENSQSTFNFDDFSQQITPLSRLDMKNGEETTLMLAVKDLLSTGADNLYIADGKKQLMIDGDLGDVLIITGLNDENNVESWLHSGKVTVAGVHYDVYLIDDNHELLIENGITTQLD